VFRRGASVDFESMEGQQRFDERFEIGDAELARGIAQGVGRIGVHFDEDPINAGRYPRPRNRRQELPRPATGVYRRIEWVMSNTTGYPMRFKW